MKGLGKIQEVEMPGDELVWGRCGVFPKIGVREQFW